jgi:hypothetical protein
MGDEAQIRATLAHLRERVDELHAIAFEGERLPAFRPGWQADVALPLLHTNSDIARIRVRTYEDGVRVELTDAHGCVLRHLNWGQRR